MSEVFWKPRLVGKRFNEHTVPLEMLKDFSALEEMLIEAAKWHYKQNHSECQRVPRGFGHDINLHLSAVEGGSATLAIAFALIPSLLPPENSVYFEKAKNSIIESVVAIDNNRTPPLPKNILSYFDKFGKGLQENEFMELKKDDGFGPVQLNKVNRRKLVEASNSDIVTETQFLRGRVYLVDVDGKQFGLELNNSAKLKAVLDVQHQEAVALALTNGLAGSKVFLKADVATQISSNKQSIVGIDEISPLEPLDVGNRLEELLNLRDGWLDGVNGKALNTEGSKHITDGFDYLFNKNLPLPFIFPTPEGGLSLEWDGDNKGVIIEVDLLTLDATYQLMFDSNDINADQEGNISLRHDRQENDGWNTLNSLITFMLENT